MTAKKRAACRRNAWRNGKRATTRGLMAHYGITWRTIKERAALVAAEEPEWGVELLVAYAIERLLSEALLADLATRGVECELPRLDRHGKKIGGTELGANPAIEHLLRLAKPHLDRFRGKRREAREEAREKRRNAEIE